MDHTCRFVNLENGRPELYSLGRGDFFFFRARLTSLDTLASYLLLLFICLFSFLLVPCASGLEKTCARVSY